MEQHGAVLDPGDVNKHIVCRLSDRFHKHKIALNTNGNLTRESLERAALSAAEMVPGGS